MIAWDESSNSELIFWISIHRCKSTRMKLEKSGFRLSLRENFKILIKTLFNDGKKKANLERRW